MDGANVEERRRCFVIGPIGDADSFTRVRADILLNAVIKEAFEKMGLDIRFLELIKCLNLE